MGTLIIPNSNDYEMNQIHDVGISTQIGDYHRTEQVDDISAEIDLFPDTFVKKTDANAQKEPVKKTEASKNVNPKFKMKVHKDYEYHDEDINEDIVATFS